MKFVHQLRRIPDEAMQLYSKSQLCTLFIKKIKNKNQSEITRKKYLRTYTHQQNYNDQGGEGSQFNRFDHSEKLPDENFMIFIQ